MTVASHQKLQDIVRKRFHDEFGDEYLVCHDNAPFTQPDDEMWVRWNVTMGESSRVDFGASTNRNRHTGVAIAQIFAVLGKGTRDATILADRIVSKFRSVTDSLSVSGNSVVFKTPSVTTVGRSDSQWWQLNVSCPFYADEIA
jgi:hypothetical protein